MGPHHLAWVSGMMGCAVLHKAILVQVRGVAVRAGKSVAVWNRAVPRPKGEIIMAMLIIPVVI